MMTMSRSDAQAIVTRAWNGETRKDPRLPQALSVLGIPMPTYSRMSRAAKGVEKRFSRLHILTPAGHGRRV